MPGVRKNDPEYDEKRAKNNSSVQACRERQRRKKQQTEEEVNKLRTENKVLEDKLKMLNMELNLLKDMYSAHNSTEAKPTTTSIPSATEASSCRGNVVGAFGTNANSSGTFGTNANSSGTSSGNSVNVVVEQLYAAEGHDWNKSGWNS